MPLDITYENFLETHYAKAWGIPSAKYTFDKGRPLPQPTKIFEYAPTDKTFTWLYSTCGMTQTTENELLELFLLSPCESQSHLELLTAIAHYHQTGAPLGCVHTVNFGRPWLKNSTCSFGLISLPYNFGPSLERTQFHQKNIRVLWLIPITAEERALKISHGLESLEQLFEQKQFHYLDPLRPSVTSP